MSTRYDAVVVGAGPNGLTAAARLARAGQRVLVLERSARVGGGSRTAQFGESGAVYDVCAAAHPFPPVSPGYRELGISDRVQWRHAPLPLVHPLPGGDAAVLHRDLSTTAAGLGADGEAYAKLVTPLLRRWPKIVDGFLAPLLPVPGHPVAMARFGVVGARSVHSLVRRFHEPRARALLAGLGAHTCIPLTSPFTGGLGLALGLTAHAVGWPFAEGGSQSLVDALATVVTQNNGEIVTGTEVRALTELPPRRATILDLTPRQILELAPNELGGWRGWGLRRWRYGPGACKCDYLLTGPMPWSAEPARRAGVVHIGGTFEDIAASEATVSRGRLAERPYVLVAQPSVADPTRAPSGAHVLWTYCHVPNGCATDASDLIERQLDRFAPGWRDLVVLKRVRTTADYESYNPNNVGGDIAGGSLGRGQLVLRPWNPLDPYRTPLKDVWMCSASTPPGAGAHGMCGWHAAGRVLSSTREPN
jgi:phytoene dehydrogenase-like protein